MWTRGCLTPNGYVIGQGKGGWRAGKQVQLVRKWTTSYFSIGTIRRIMVNRIRMNEEFISRFEAFAKEHYNAQS